MVEWLGHKTYRLDRLRLDGDWRAQLADPEVAARAASIERLGLIQEPVVRASDRRLIAGRQRVAAYAQLGLDTIEARTCECTDDEAVEIALAENVERRHLTPEQLRTKIEATVSALTAEIAAATGKKRAGRGPKGSAQADAERRVAELLGVKPEAIARRRQRAEKRRQRQTTPAAEPSVAPVAAPPPPALPPPIVTYGLDCDAAWLERVHSYQERFDAALQLLARVATLVTEAEKLAVAPASRFQLLRRDMQALRETAKGSRAWSLCPWCKGQADLWETCPGCMGTTLALEHQRGGCPVELTDTEHLQVSDHGRLVPVAPPDTPEEQESWEDFG